MTQLGPDEPHALYRFYGAGGTLLYIGITNSIPVRLKAHNKDKPWWLGVTNITVEHYPNRRAVLEAEKRAIKSERPLYNEVHNPTPLANGDYRDQEYYLGLIRESIGEEQTAKQVDEERFMGTPDELIAIEIACSTLSHYAVELDSLREAVDGLIAAMPDGCRTYLQDVIDHHGVTLDEKEFQPGFLSTITDWILARRKPSVGA